MTNATRWRLALAGGVVGWLAFVSTTARYVWISVMRYEEQPFFVGYDWRVYATGAEHLLDRSLYAVRLAPGGMPIPVDHFNLPPLAAALALPLLPLSFAAAVAVWQVVNAAALAFAVTVVPRLLGLAHRWWLPLGGIALGAYALSEHVPSPDELNYWWGLVLGNNSFLVLGMVAAFSVAYRSGRDRPAGLLLALAVGTKVWPVAVLPFLLREGRWTVLRWAAAGLALQALVFLAWLGPDVVPDMIRALGTSVEARTLVIGVSAPGEILPWWPPWAPVVVAGLLVLIPARGLVGLGLGLLAGLAAIDNLWGHYLPSIGFAAALVATPLVHRYLPGLSR